MPSPQLQPGRNKYHDLANLVPVDTEEIVPLWEPQAGPQAMAYHSAAFETLYGGAAGAGKSSLILGLSLTAHKRTKIFRRELTQLNGMVDELHDMLDPLSGNGRDQPKWNGQRLFWRDVPGRRMIQLAAMKESDDWKKHKGQAYDLFAFDELTEFEERQYTQVIGWARSASKGQRVRIIGATNPNPDAQGEWVIQRWAPWLDPEHPNPAMAGELRWYCMEDGVEVERPDGEPYIFTTATGEEERLVPRSRTFIPGRLKDNKYLAGTDYEANLMNLPEPLRSQLLKGVWTFSRSDSEYQVIPSAWVQAAMDRWTPDNPGGYPLHAMGVDPSRGGREDTVIAKRHGPWMDEMITYAGSETPDGPAVVKYIADVYRDRALINLDIIGVGSSVYDSLLGTDGFTHVNPVVASARSDETDKSGLLKMRNKRAELWWKMREMLDPDSDEEQIALPPNPQLKMDLTAPQYHNTLGGITIESKDDVRKRLKRSTDMGDACVMAFADISGGFRPAKIVSMQW